MRLGLIAAGLALAAAGAHAQNQGMESTWKNIAATDAAAALKFIEDNHPGAAPELGDKAFLEMLARARTHVEQRLPQATSYGAYVALMNGLAADFRDRHIMTKSQLTWNWRRWTGIVPLRRGGKWVVGLHDAARGEPVVANAEILACDGEPFERWATARIDQFSGNAAVEATLVRHGPELLVDDANPYLKKPVACTFRLPGGEPQSLTLSWRRIQERDLQDKIARLIPPPPKTMGVSQFAAGYWISVSTLGPGALELVEAVNAQGAALREAPMVIVDFRGNSGGNSSYADQIAKVLVGNGRFEAAKATPPSDCKGSYWRASSTNLLALTAYREGALKRGDAGHVQWLDTQIGDITQARADKQTFGPALPPCAASVRPVDQSIVQANLPAPAMKGKLVIVTDYHCFSSCLLAANTFRKLGALHVGEATDLTTRYMEFYEEPLPSGLRWFSTLQKVALSMSDFGPYQPALTYPGDLSDDRALKDWVAALGKK